MTARQTTGAFVLALACLASCEVGRAADTEERIEQFETMLSEELGMDVQLRCPPMIDNTAHYCTAVVPGREDLVFPVRVVSRGNELDYATKQWVSGKRMVELGKHALEEKYDIEVDSLSCPPISHLPEGATARCEAMSEGVVIPIEVGMVSKVRKLSFEPVAGVVFGDAAARVAHERLHEQGGHVEVTCPQRVIVSVSGKRFECKALMPDQTVVTIHYLITDTNGSFELGTEPPQTGSVAGSDAAGESSPKPASEHHHAKETPA